MTFHEPGDIHTIKEPTVRGVPFKSDGLTASCYGLPEGATELYHLIIHKNMNAQVGEAFRSLYRMGESSHSDNVRDCNKVIAYMNQELERLNGQDNS